MKFAPGRRRSIRYSIFIGVLAGSVFSGSGAFATVFEINSQVDLEAIGNNLTTRAGDYILMSDLNLTPPAPEKSTYIEGTFTGTLDGNGKTLFGLTKPLFDSIGEAVNINDEDGNPIEASGENLIYVDESGREISSDRAAHLLESGEYIDTRVLYEDKSKKKAFP